MLPWFPLALQMEVRSGLGSLGFQVCRLIFVGMSRNFQAHRSALPCPAKAAKRCAMAKQKAVCRLRAASTAVSKGVLWFCTLCLSLLWSPHFRSLDICSRDSHVAQRSGPWDGHAVNGQLTWRCGARPVRGEVIKACFKMSRWIEMDRDGRSLNSKRSTYFRIQLSQRSQQRWRWEQLSNERKSIPPIGKPFHKVCKLEDCRSQSCRWAAQPHQLQQGYQRMWRQVEAGDGADSCPIPTHPSTSASSLGS